MLPYISPSFVVPDAHRCKFVLRSQEAINAYEQYQDSRRYRLNNWQPIIDTFPACTRRGLKFQTYNEDPLTGMVSSWYLQAGDTAEVSFVIPSYIINSFHVTPDSYAAIGVGFMRYTSDYWLPINALELACHRKVGTPTQFYFTTLRQKPIGPTALCNLGSALRFILRVRGNVLSIAATEYADDGITPVATTGHSITVDPGAQYRAVLFIRSTTDCETTTIVARTEFTGMRGKTNEEIIFFHENPPTSGFKHPSSTLRERMSLIQQPHTAYVEDGDIQITAPMTPIMWFNMMRYLVDNTIEPVEFTDIFGDPWLVCLGNLSGDGPSNRRGKIRTGYTLTMPVLVMH